MLLGKTVRTDECVYVCSCYHTAVEADIRFVYNVYPAMAETCNLFEIVATNKNNNKKNSIENNHEKSWGEKENQFPCITQQKLKDDGTCRDLSMIPWRGCKWQEANIPSKAFS